MKKIILLPIFFLIMHCANNNLVYWCGDHPCVNKKEKEEYFKKTMIVEVKNPKNSNSKTDSYTEKLKKQILFDQKKINKSQKELAKQKDLEEKRKIKEQKELTKEIKLEEKKLKESNKKSKQKVNINKNRIGVVKILNQMGAKIKFQNKKIYKSEINADIHVKSIKKIKPIKCSKSLNSSAIDEFLVIFLVAAKAKGISTFKNLSELNKKESPRLNYAVNFLKMIGIKVKRKNDDIKIFGNPNLILNRNFIVKNFLKDHRIFMMSCVAALTFGGKWKIFDKSSINTSFPKFLNILKSLGAKIN